MEERGIPERRPPILGSSPQRPIPVGVTAKTTISHGEGQPLPEDFNVEITLLEVVRGEAVMNRLKAESGSNQPPTVGFEYVLARIKFGYSRKARAPFAPPSYVLSEEAFGAASADGTKEYEIASLEQRPQPPLTGASFSVGDSREGWIVFEVPQGEERPLLVFHRERVSISHRVWTPVWFRLFAFDPMRLDGLCLDCC